MQQRLSPPQCIRAGFETALVRSTRIDCVDIIIFYSDESRDPSSFSRNFLFIAGDAPTNVNCAPCPFSHFRNMSKSPKNRPSITRVRERSITTVLFVPIKVSRKPAMAWTMCRSVASPPSSIVAKSWLGAILMERSRGQRCDFSRDHRLATASGSYAGEDKAQQRPAVMRIAPPQVGLLFDAPKPL